MRNSTSPKFIREDLSLPYRIPEIEDQVFDEIFRTNSLKARDCLVEAYTDSIKRIKSHFPNDAKTILEAACGPGYFATLLSDAFPNARIIAEDVDPKSIRMASELNLPRPNLEYHVGDAYTTSERHNNLDGIVICESLHHLELGSALSQFYQGLKSGGVLWAIDLDRSYLTNQRITNNPLLNNLKEFLTSGRESYGDTQCLELLESRDVLG